MICGWTKLCQQQFVIDPKMRNPHFAIVVDHIVYTLLVFIQLNNEVKS